MSPYGAIPRPVSSQSLDSVLPRHSVLKSKSNEDPSTDPSTNVTLFRIASKDETLDSTSETYCLSGAKHASLVEAMHQVFNDEVKRGDTYPQEFVLSNEEFEGYFFSGDAFVLIKGHHAQALDVNARDKPKDWDQDLLGFFYVKPNFPGRCSHICNGGFVVNPLHRGLGIGSILGKSFLKLVPVIGFKASMFNLVFESNVASIKLWRRLGFKESGRVPKAGRLRGQGTQGADNEGYVDAIQFYWDFETMPVPAEYDA